MDVPAQGRANSPFLPFCSVLTSKDWLSSPHTHTHNGKGHLLIQMPISSRNPLTDTPEIASHQLSGRPLSPAKWTHNINHHTLHGGGKPALQSIPSAETENSTSQPVPPTLAFMLTALCLEQVSKCPGVHLSQVQVSSHTPLLFFPPPNPPLAT